MSLYWLRRAILEPVALCQPLPASPALLALLLLVSTTCRAARTQQTAYIPGASGALYAVVDTDQWGQLRGRDIQQVSQHFPTPGIIQHLKPLNGKTESTLRLLPEIPEIGIPPPLNLFIKVEQSCCQVFFLPRRRLVIFTLPPRYNACTMHKLVWQDSFGRKACRAWYNVPRKLDR